ncbi:hypothetical protein FOZ62_007686 [Perkinsus olseni]|uniref:VWFA domain-containing protein n=1 Tax=Perkinsus olseni TaxID=32597 RepID=A0A7J6RAI5_PEROL|nr:hypothetical protein FOZ62_007686 [Perkinsus olseni]
METHGTQGIILDPGFIDKPCENRGKNTLCAPRPSFDMEAYLRAAIRAMSTGTMRVIVIAGYTPHSDNTTETCAHHLLQEITDQDPGGQQPVYLDMRDLEYRLGPEDLLSEEQEPTTVLYCGHIAGLYSLVLQSTTQQIGDQTHWVLVEHSGRGCGVLPSLPFPRSASISCIAPPTYEPLDSLAQQLVLVEDALKANKALPVEDSIRYKRAASQEFRVLSLNPLPQDSRQDDRHSAALRVLKAESLLRDLGASILQAITGDQGEAHCSRSSLSELPQQSPDTYLSSQTHLADACTTIEDSAALPLEGWPGRVDPRSVGVDLSRTQGSEAEEIIRGLGGFSVPPYRVLSVGICLASSIAHLMQRLTSFDGLDIAGSSHSEVSFVHAASGVEALWPRTAGGCQSSGARDPEHSPGYLAALLATMHRGSHPRLVIIIVDSSSSTSIGSETRRGDILAEAEVLIRSLPSYYIVNVIVARDEAELIQQQATASDREFLLSRLKSSVPNGGYNLTAAFMLAAEVAASFDGDCSSVIFSITSSYPTAPGTHDEEVAMMAWLQQALSPSTRIFTAVMHGSFHLENPQDTSKRYYNSTTGYNRYEQHVSRLLNPIACTFGGVHQVISEPKRAWGSLLEAYTSLYTFAMPNPSGGRYPVVWEPTKTSPYTGRQRHRACTAVADGLGYPTPLLGVLCTDASAALATSFGHDIMSMPDYPVAYSLLGPTTREHSECRSPAVTAVELQSIRLKLAGEACVDDELAGNIQSYQRESFAEALLEERLAAERPQGASRHIHDLSRSLCFLAVLVASTM